MKLRAGSKVVLKASASEMDLRFDIDQIEVGKVYKVAIVRKGLCLLVTGPGLADRIAIETKALQWAA